MTLEARVKKSFVLPITQACGGVEFLKAEWRPVPVDREDEARKTDFLEVRMVMNGGSNQISKPAQKLAEEEGIDLSKVSGTGSNGNITIGDVRSFIASLVSS